MTLRTFAGLGALLSSNSALAPISRANAGAGEVLAALPCQTHSGLARCLVMGMPDRLAVQGGPVIQGKRDKDL